MEGLRFGLVPRLADRYYIYIHIPRAPSVSRRHDMTTTGDDKTIKILDYLLSAFLDS